MRWVICALFVVGMMLGTAPNAFAGDFDMLRGSQSVGPATYTRWSGFYFGGQFSYGNSSTDFSQATRSLVAFSLRELALENEQHPSQWQVLGSNSTYSAGFGGFAGYNTQWQDLIVGIEANYTRSSFTAVAPVSPLGRVTSAGGNTYGVDLTGSASLSMIDFGSIRARAGLSMGNVLPYMFGGLALGRADYTRTSLVSGQQNPPTPAGPCDPITSPTCVAFSFANSETKNSALMYGFSVGGGIDVALTSNLFVRGELEYVRFAPIGDILVSVTTARLGAGLKF